MNGTKQTPYVGTRPFKTNESKLFFGRDREALDLLSLVISERLVLFYAQSGAGKSSLINTKLIPGLVEEQEFQLLPVGRVGGSEASSDVDNIYVYHLINSILRQEVRRDDLSSLTLSEFLKGRGTDHDTVLKTTLIIDQFEELFSTHQEAWEKREDFFRQLAQAMQDLAHLWVVLVIREDYIAYIDPYVYLLPGKLRVRYYMQRLERDGALQAIKKPVEKLRPYAEGVAEKLVENLAGIKVQKPNGELEVRPGQFVESVQLQVVCQNLWEHLPPGGTEITQNDLDSVGDVDQALERYYEDRVSTVAQEHNLPEREIREWFENELITTGRMRNMVLHGKKQSAGLDNDVIRALQGNLVRSEVRAGQTWYELSHDRLIEPVLKSNAKWFSTHLNFFQRQAALWNERGRSEGLLLRRAELREAEAWAEANKDKLTENEELFLKACQEARHEAREKALANKRIRNALWTSRLIAGVALILLVVSILLGIGSYQNQRTRQMQVLMGASSEALNSDEYLAAILAYQALINYGDHGEAEQALGKVVNQNAGEKKPIESRFSQFSDVNVLALAFGPDGNTLASGYSDGGIILSDISNSQPIGKPLTGHLSWISSVAFSPDGKILASGSGDQTVFLWDVETHQTIASLNKHTDVVNSVAFSPNGEILASGSYDGTIILWDTQTYQPIAELRSGHGAVSRIAFSMDGKLLASGSGDNTVLIWDVATRQPIGEPLSRHTGWVYGVIFSPDGKTLASGGADVNVILWDVATRQPIGEPLLSPGVYDVTFSPNGRILASVGIDGTITLWDVATRQPIGEPLLSPGVYNVTFSPDGRILASGGSDGTITLWDLQARPPVETSSITKSGGKTSVRSMSIASGGTTINAISTDGTMVLWNQKNDEITIGSSLPEDLYNFTSVAFSEDAKIMVLGGGDGSISVRDAVTDEEIAQLGNHNGGVSALTLSPDSKYVVSGGFDGTARVWEIASKTEIASVKHRGSGTSVTSVAISPDGKYVASSGNSDRTTLIWEALTGKKIAQVIHDSTEDANEFVVNSAFGPDGTRVVTVLNDRDGTITVWDLETRQPLLVISNGRLKSLTYSLGGINTLGSQRNQSEGANTTQTDQTGVGVADVEFSPDGLFILYQNGIMDQWTIWPSRTELKKYAEGVCGTCELTYEQREDFELYTWPMQVTNLAGYLFAIISLLGYGLFNKIVYRSVLTRPQDPDRTQSFTWRKFLLASVQGMLLTLTSLLSWVLLNFFEMMYYGPENARYLEQTILRQLLLVLPFGLWAGGAYSHFTRLQAGKWARTKRSIIGMLAGFVGGLVAGFFGAWVLRYAEAGDLMAMFTDFDWVPVVLVIGGALGLMSLFGALIYIFWLYPWSERRWLRQQQEEDF